MKRTYQPSKLVRKRRHGFRARTATKGGRKVLAARRAHGRAASVRDGRASPAQVFAMERLKRRTDFGLPPPVSRRPARVRVAGAPARSSGAVRIGFTVSRQVGNAVERNRVRRRLREMVRLAGGGKLHAGYDYVLIGRRAALELPFGEMMRELDAALKQIHVRELGPTGGARPRPLHGTGSPASPRPKPRRRAPMREH